MYSSRAESFKYLEDNKGTVYGLPEDFVLTDNSRSEPPYVKFSLHPLLKKKSNSERSMLWCIGFDGVCTWTLTGTTGGKMRIIIKEVKLNKSEKNYFQQAYQYCVKEYNDKVDKNYRREGDTSQIFRLGMKGEVYEEGCIQFPAIGTTKLDGVRGLVHPCGDSFVFHSYSGKDIGHLTHIVKDLERLLSFFPENTTLDGEIYCHGMDLPKIRGFVNAKVNIPDDIFKLQYWIYDAIWDDETTYDDRSTGYVQCYEEYLEEYGEDTSISVLRPSIINSHDELMELVNEAEMDGYEGMCIKHSQIGRVKGTAAYNLSLYNYATRSKATFKCKRYSSAEGLVVGLEDCEGNEAGLPKLLVKISTGHVIPIRFGSFLERKEWAEDPSIVEGRIIEYRYFCLDSKSGIPQQPTGKSFRDPE